ncbi:MAG: membrane protein of unknown function [Promethearchaeota archaeon]|nr:MAG: membrane protein of unknown function [Candidatus Lokiarchaeota archaeon]
MSEEIILNFIGMIFESFIIIIAVILLILIMQRYYEKRHELTLYLFSIFLNYVIAILFSWLSKIMVVAQIFNILDPTSLLGWFLYRIKDFRLSEFFVVIGIFISYIFKVKIFDDGEYNLLQKYLVIAYGIASGIYILIFYQVNNVLLDVIAFLLVAFYMCIIYIPFMRSSIKAYKSVEQEGFKNAFLSLTVMAFSFLLIFFNFFIDRLFILFGSLGFTLFYYLAWSFVLVSVISAYLGYIKPKSKE